MSWKQVTIGELVTLQRGHDLTEAERKPGIVPVIGSAGQNGTHNVALQKGPGFTIGRSGGSVGKVTFVATDYWPHNTCLYARDLKENDPRFLAYFLSLQNLAQLNSGAAQPSLNRNFVHAQKVNSPDLPTQQRIASILSAYDDLIEKNRRRIVLLEQSARLLYREWFVHFRFPGHETAKFVDGLPEGWKIKSYADLFEFLGGHAFKSSSYTPDGRFGIVTIKNVHDSKFIPERSSRISDIPQNMKSHCKLVTSDVLLSLTGNVGRACIVIGEDYLLNQRVAKIEGKQGIPKTFVYWSFCNPNTMKELEKMAYGVAQLNLSPIQVSGRPFIAPPQLILDSYDANTRPILDQIIILSKQNVQLTRARNLLLPRLMDGRIPV